MANQAGVRLAGGSRRMRSPTLSVVVSCASLAAACMGGVESPRGDTSPPSAIADLAASGATTTSIRLTWTAPGDDGASGTATAYDLRYSTSPIAEANWAAAAQASTVPAPQPSGSAQALTVEGLAADALYYLAIKTRDEAANVSALSNVASSRTATLSGPGLYVDKDSVGGACSDDNPGSSPGAPVCTIDRGLTLAQPGDTVFVRRGTYPRVTVSKSGASGSPLTLKAYPGETPVIDANFDTSYAAVTINGQSHLVIDGLEIRGSAGSYKAGVYIHNGSHHVVVRNCHLHHNYRPSSSNSWVFGIYVRLSSYVLLESNDLHDNDTSGIRMEGDATTVGNQLIGNTSYNHTLSGGDSDGIGMTGAGMKGTVIRGNECHHNSDDGIDVWNTEETLVEFNLCHHNGGGGDGNGLKMGGSTTGGLHTVRFNVSYANQRYGFEANGNGGTTFLHNVAYDNVGWGFSDGWRTSGSAGCPGTARCRNHFMNNIGFDNGDGTSTGNFVASSETGSSDFNLWYRTGGAAGLFYDYSSKTLAQLQDGYGLDLHSLVADPLFADAAGFDFHLQATSPAIDHGDPANPGQVAVLGSAPDIGRYETR